MNHKRCLKIARKNLFDSSRRLHNWTRSSRQWKPSKQLEQQRRLFSEGHTTGQPLQTIQDYRAFDQRHLIHPYASLTAPPPAIFVEEAEGCYLHLSTGEKVIDGMASWWAVIHGYRRPELDEALISQLGKMSHVMFGGLSHKPAIDLTKRLLEVVPKGLEKVFLCDSGSVSVEVAMKMALQFWYRHSAGKKNQFLTIRNGYHGDTFGAMSVCDPVNGMHNLFSGVLPKHLFVSSPSSNSSMPDQVREEQSLAELEEVLRNKGGEIAAVILEPLVQGAGGMKFYSFDYLLQVRDLTKRYNTLLICDEIATGFGRTGTLFACQEEGSGTEVVPDIMCLGKALAGGYMTTGATLATRDVCEGISGESAGGLPFMHGPTFMANPLVASVSLASLNLLLSSPWKQRVRAIEQTLLKKLQQFEKYSVVQNVRVKGAIGVVELKQPLYDYTTVERAQQILIGNGVWLRPFNKLLYTMPIFNCPLTTAEVERIADAIEALLQEIDHV